MTTPQISPLPPMPARTDAPVDFSAKADAALAALQPFADQANALALDANAKATAAASSAASVAGVQTAVNNDRVLSQQAAQNAAGSAAAAGVSATSAQNSATAAGLSATASEASAVRAEDAAQYVESITDGAAPINNPNFTGVVKVNNVPLGYAATAPTVGWGDEVMRAGAGGWLSRTPPDSYIAGYPQNIGQSISQIYRKDHADDGVEAHSASIHFATSDTWGRLRVWYDSPSVWVQGGVSTIGSGWTAELYHASNLLNIGTTAATARTALNLFADASGVMTNGPGQLSNDMSNFLSSTTFDEMSSKIGGGGEIDFTTIATNATALTPQAGKSYWLNRNTSSLLTTTLACTHRPGKIRSWHMIVSKNAGAGDNFIPKFAITGLSQSFVAWSGGGVEPPVVSGVSHVMIAFTQIDQSVRAMVVDGW